MLLDGYMRQKHKKHIVALLLEGKLNITQIAVDVGCRKSTVAYHAKNLGKKSKRQRQYDWTEIQEYHNVHNRAECIRKFGCTNGSWDKAIARGVLKSVDHRLTLDVLLVDGRKATSRLHLKKKLIKAGLLVNVCAWCGIFEWREKSLTLHLDHINGKRNDNRLENLRLLCPNCHSQTPTYGGKNNIGRWSNGTTSGSDPEDGGSIPSRPI